MLAQLFYPGKFAQIAHERSAIPLPAEAGSPLARLLWMSSRL